ncbi:MAG: hypothetical protein HY562_07250 [Ignavibacteriales bacterium]|nr:hypothetical protein [Ignavibacteriales bacterium]
MAEPDDSQNPTDFELTHVVVPGEEGRDHVAEMAETFVIELKRMHWSNEKILAAFRNPFYAGPYYAFKERGEEYVRDLVESVWSKPE